MPTGVFDSLLLGHVWGTDELRAIFSDENRVQKWFDYEAALAAAQAELGIIPQAAASPLNSGHWADMPDWLLRANTGSS